MPLGGVVTARYFTVVVEFTFHLVRCCCGVTALALFGGAAVDYVVVTHCRALLPDVVLTVAVVVVVDADCC